jgi:hypothetical protein
MPMRMDAGKRATICNRQRDTARKLYRAGLLTEEGLAKVFP